jgi:PAS domain S-box-containing protein
MESRIIRILAIDDNPDNLVSIRALIQDAFPGAVTFTVLNGAKGFELAAAEDPDVILLDIVMPGMDGFDVCKKLKADKKLCDIPVVFLTALKGDPESRIRALECGGDAFLAKPIDKSELTAQIRAMLKVKQTNIAKLEENERLTSLVAEQFKEITETQAATLNLLEEASRENAARKKIEKALQESEERFALAMKASTDGLFDWNLQANAIYYSPGWKKMLGYEDHELPNDFSVWEKTTDPEDVKKSWELQQKLISRQIDRFVLEFKMKHKEGHWVDILSRAEANFNEHGKAIRIVGTHTDITELKQTELELVKAKERAEESDRLKSAFLANMSHEIRTPMNGILGFTELLKEPDLTDPEKEKYIDIIEKSGARLLNIINDIISISKVESGQMAVNLSEININDQIEYLCNFFKPEAEQKGITVSFSRSLSGREAILTTDREKVYAILTNLIKNALKFTHVGSIEVGYSLETVETDYDPSLHDPSLRYVFYVKDTGIGITPEQREFIFERFRQGTDSLIRVYEGAGLGLSISKAYVEMLGGRIWVESEPGKGSTFYFALPG